MKLREIDVLEGKERESVVSESTLADSEETRLRQKLCECSYVAALAFAQAGKPRTEVDGSTDVSNVKQLLGLVCVIGKQDIRERMLFCKSMEGQAAGHSLFQEIMERTDFFKLDSKKGVAIPSDGASSMTGKNVRFVKYFKEVARNSSWYHCIIHKYALAVKPMLALLKEVMHDSVKIVNFIKSSSLNRRLFAVLFEELGAEFSQLLYHTEVRWLSRGKVLNRIFYLKDEVCILLSDSKHELAYKFDDKLVAVRNRNLFENPSMTGAKRLSRPNRRTRLCRQKRMRKQPSPWRNEKEELTPDGLPTRNACRQRT
ncbi:protein FAM200A-like [Belonocnema kinseyi]|uniref:protein FAM200A-like n=1 Tax=Belonocnema kinseyi TaxID=2817044 RepID=UPI00143CD3E2|nr:protein FAM200A-like [Belonocnema kinseyi]